MGVDEDFSDQKRASVPRATGSTQKNLTFLVSRHNCNKKFGCSWKTNYIGPKNAFLSPISLFLHYAHIAPFFGLRQAQLNEIITSPSGFLVGGRSAARWAVFWHRLPKLALFGANNALFCMLSYSIV